MSIGVDISKAKPHVTCQEIDEFQSLVKEKHKLLHNDKASKDEFLGWVDLPINYDREELNRIKICSKKIQEKSQVLVVIGIGGSYLGARAAIEMLTGTFNNFVLNKDKNSVKILYAGNNISSTYLADLIKLLEEVDFSVNVISKSGTTTEPAIAFRLLKKLLEKKYGITEAKERIFVTTDKEKGALRTLAEAEEYESFIIPDNIGGRYSVLTAVGLLPIASAGIDVEEILKGAADAREEYKIDDLKNNAAYRYAVARNILYNKGKTIEILANFEPSLHFMGEWWKQLFGESEGKDNKGIFPATADFSTELHSIGQYIQEGMRNLIETHLNIEKHQKSIIIGECKDNLDGLNFLAGKDINYINEKAFMGTVIAHKDGGVPNIIIDIPEVSPYYFGYLVYFFEKACAMSGYILGVNPFNQPGVEAYKNNMFALLGKPGYDKLKTKIELKLQQD